MADTQEDRYRPLNPIPTTWIVGQFVFLAVAAFALVIFYDRIPDPMPVHFGPAGEPDSWTEKSVSDVVVMFGIAAVPMAFLNPFILYVVHSQAKNAHKSFPKKPDDAINWARAAANEQLPILAQFFTWMTILLVGGVTLSLLGFARGPFVFPLLVVLLIGLMVWFGFALRGAMTRVTEQEGPGELGSHMRWGMFYVNPEDDRVLVDHTMGTTLNFARPGAWLFLAALLIPIVVVIVALIATE